MIAWKEKLLRKTALFIIITLVVYVLMHILYSGWGILIVTSLFDSLMKVISAKSSPVILIFSWAVLLILSLVVSYRAKNIVLKYMMLAVLAVTLYIVDIILIEAIGRNAVGNELDNLITISAIIIKTLILGSVYYFGSTDYAVRFSAEN